MRLSLKKLKIEKARRSLIDFTQYTFPKYQVNWHHRAIASKLDEWVAGKIRKLMILCPPRHGKSELVSRRLPAYIFGKIPDAEIIATSFADSLAKRVNRDVQRIIDSDLYRDVFPETTLSRKNIRADAHGTYLRNSDIFEIVNYTGSYRGCGIGGGISGMGAHFGIIDDPIKNSEQAASKSYRKRAWEWYQSTFSTRIETMSDGTGGNILLTLTPWHEDDLRGRILKTEAHEWTVLKIPAISEVSMEGDPRAVGEALWSWKKSLEELEKIKNVLGSYFFNALYQGDPRPLDGNIVNISWFQRYSTVPNFTDIIVQSWDTAQKAGELNDYSVCETWVVKGIRKYLIDVHRAKHEYPELEKACLSQYDKYKPGAVLIEDKSSGTSLIQSVKSKMPVIPIVPCSDKVTRMATESPQIQAGTVFLPERADWLTDYESEISGFPKSEHDDQVDSTSQFLRWVRSRPGKTEYQIVDEVLKGRGF